MKCLECEKQGLKNKVYPLGGTKTLAYCPPYYDDDGCLHHHDSNIRTERYKCSNGHFWKEKLINKCACGWTNKRD